MVDAIAATPPAGGGTQIVSIMTDSFAGVFLIGMIEVWSFTYPHLSLEKKKTSSNC
jgi:hypothetical protein